MKKPINRQDLKKVLKLFLLIGGLVFLLLCASIAILLILNRNFAVSITFEQSIHIILSIFIFLMFPVIHRAQARWFWFTRHRTQEMPQWMSVKAPALPEVNTPRGQKILYIFLDLIAIILLFIIFLPFHRQVWIYQSISAITTSARLYILCLSMLCLCIFTLFSGLLFLGFKLLKQSDSESSLARQLLKNWMYSYVFTMTICIFISCFSGFMILRYLATF
ncbi:hypothetical protein [Acinetobacter sp. MD2(2019)]|uniref:hypothetical protein n=1 Tax=Acinetobacter sp. MD2(2019) TaxID=2605273 RepID=UPI002D1E6187|nr:hypothetical protein [Acinetobacter sp. MD2(2019)]MEB3754793.1 hypothetical protein [Acinetobacter sp. MD2(2019)]